MAIVLETKRLVLMHTKSSDFADLLALRTDPDVMQHIGTGAIQTKEQVQEFIDNAEPYRAQYGLAFYSVFDKKSGVFIGQAGLFHLGFNVNETDIELAYRLQKKYWDQGYATELAKALIHYGFTQLGLPKIVAIVHTENERSRRVMEKAGMSYGGKINFKEHQMPCYEIYNNDIEHAAIDMLSATIQDYPILQNLGRFYAYDMSEYSGNAAGWDFPANGLYECIDFKKYWETDNAYPFLLKYRNELIGFVIIDQKGSQPDIDFNMAQFYIVRKFRGKGVGSYVAQQCFDKFQGAWEVMVTPGNESAYRFWRRTLKKYCGDQFTEYSCEIAHFAHKMKNIFKFASRD